MYSPLSVSERKSRPLSSFMRDNFAKFLLFARLRKSELGFSEFKPSKSFIDFIFSETSELTMSLSSRWACEISSAFIRKSSLSELIFRISCDFFAVEILKTQDWKLMIELFMEPIRASRKISSSQDKAISESRSGSGRFSIFSLSSALKPSFVIFLISVNPFREMSYSKSLIFLIRARHSPTFTFPSAMLTPGLMTWACWRWQSATAAARTSGNIGLERMQGLIDCLFLNFFALKLRVT